MEDDDPELEWKIRALAIPIAIVLAIAFHAWPTGHWLQRTFLSMIVHELGHAITAWWCGFAAIPTVWKTLIPETRAIWVTLVLAAGPSFVVWRAWVAQRTWIVVLALAALAVQLIATFSTSVDRAHEAITFGGDAGAMVLGTLMMMSMFAPAESRLRTNQLRWGLLVIGAAAYVDTFATWWAARTDPDVIPFGEIEGVGLSDPSKLDEVYGWSVRQLVDRHVTVGVACLLALAAVWAWATWRARQLARA